MQDYNVQRLWPLVFTQTRRQLLTGDIGCWMTSFSLVGEKERPDRVRPGLTNEKELSHYAY